MNVPRFEVMELFWTLEAIEDRNNIYDHIEADGPTAALDLDEMFEGVAAGLLSRARSLWPHKRHARTGRPSELHLDL